MVHGQAGVAVQGNTLTVTNTPGTVIHWQGFSIAGNEITRFIQQSQSSSVLNRVVGLNPSAILGSLQSNGRVFLVNPNGITIGAGAQIDVAGFLASTLNLSDADFLAGRMRFTDGAVAGSVVNHGNITTPGGGMVYLVGRDVQNSGIIRSPQGDILLAAGNSIELVDAQMPEVRVQLTAPDNQSVNLGQLIAEGGSIGMYGALVRHAGVASANTAVMGENGRIQFKAVKDAVLGAGSVTSASGAGAGISGGSVLIEGGNVVSAGTLAANAGDHADAGSVTVVAQRELRLESGSRIEARGADYGSRGGRVYLYSHGDAFAEPGQVIDISGGVFSGHGGSGEFSAARFARFGGSVYGTAAQGYDKGRFLIDPLNFSLAAGTISADTVIQAEDNITIDGDVSINAGFTLTLLADHDDNGGSPAAGVWDTGGGGTGTVGVGSITRSGAFTISGGAGSNLAMYAAGGGIGIGGSGAIQTDLNGGSLSVTINPAAVGAANVAVTQTGSNALSVAGISAAGRNVALTSGGTIDQTGAITAGLLTTTSVGGTVLNAANAVGSFNATNTTSGNIELTNTAAPLGITGISQAGGDDVIISNTGAITVGGATVTAGDLTLTASSTIGQSGAIAADLLTTSSAGGTLLNSANTVGAFKATNTGTGNIVLTNTAATLDLQGIAQNTGDVVIANTGAITQSAAGITTAANGGISVTASTELTVSQAVTAGGSGSVTLAGGNVTNTSTVTGAGGVSINAGSGTFVNESSAIHQGIISNGGGAAAVSIVADNVDLRTGGTAGDSQVNAGTATATIRASTANRSYDLGTETGGRLSLTATELDTVTAGGIAIGSTGSEGNINVSAAIAPANASRLELLAGGASGSITQTGTITETDLRLNSAGAITLNAANSVTNVAIGGGNSAVSFNNAGALNIATVNGQVGAGTTGGNLSITATGGDLTIGQAVNAGTGQTDLATATSGDIVIGANVSGGTVNVLSVGNIARTAGTVGGTDVLLDAATGIGGGTGSRVFTAADNLAARSTGSGGVFVSESNAVTLTTLSGVANVAAGGAAYDLTAGGTITVSTAVNAGPATGSTTLETTAGNIALAADVGNAGGATTLTSAGEITRTAGSVIGNGVLLDAATAIGSSGVRIATTADTLAARTGTGATGGIFITEADSVGVDTVGAVSGISAGNGGAADLRTTAGDITLAANVGASGSGNVTLIAGGGAGNDLVAGAGVVSTGSGLVTLQGDAVGTTVAPILTDLGSGTLAATSSAGNIAISNSTAGGLNASQLTGLTTGGGVQTVSIVQTAGHLTVGGSLNVGGDTLVLGASAGNILGGAGTLTAAALTLEADGLIGGASAVNTSTSGTLTLNSAGSAAAGNITVSEANALPASRVSLGGAGADSGRAVKLTSVAGPITIDAAIGNAADHLELVTAAGNIAGGAGTISATNLTLNAAVGIGAGTAVNTNTSGNLSLTTAGNGTAGDIALVESNALNTTRVSALTTSGTGTQSVSLTAPSITLGAAIGNGSDNLTLIAGSGTISGSSIVTANDLRLDAHNGIGSTGVPVQINTAGNFAARLTNVSATGDIVVEEVAAGAGLNVGTANGLSGVASTNNRAITLSAVSGNIVVNQQVNSSSGQLGLTTTGSGNVSVAAGISGGLVDISSAGTISDSAQISGSTLTTSSVGGTILDFGHAVSGFNASNITGGNIQLVNTASTLTVTGISQNGGGNVIVNNTGALTIGGAINNAGSGGAINLTGSTGINLNQNLSATDGAVTLNNGTTLGASVQIAAGTGTVTLTGAVGIGSHNLSVTSSGVTVLTGGIIGTTGNIDIAAATRTDVDGAIALSGAGNVQLDRAVVSGVNVSSSGGGITFDGAAGTDTGPVQVASGDGSVLFNDTLTLGSGAGLSVLSGTGTTTFGAAVNGPAALAVTAAGNTIFNGTVGAGTALASLSTDGGGTTQLNGGSVATTGGQNYSDAVTLGANMTLTANSITFGSTLNSAGAARALQINDSGTTTFSDTVGNSLALASLTTNAVGATAINGGSISTSGAQVYNDAVTLGADTTMSGSGITFSSMLNSSGAARTLQVNDSGTTTFGGTVGNSLALASLATNAGGSTAINTTTLNTAGAQTYNDAVTLGADAVLASSGGSDIRFLNTLDGASGLTVNTTGATLFAMAVGSTTPLAFLTTDAGGSTQVNGGALVTSGAQTYNDAVSIGGATTFNATASSAALAFNSTLAAAAHALTLSADEINLGGGAGSVTGTDTAALQPHSTTAAINVGSAAGATVGALDLAAADIAALADGFAAVRIGRADGAHAVSVGNASFQDPLLVRAPAAGSIAVNGALSGTQQVTLEAGGTVQGSGSVTAPLVKIVAGGIGSFATPLQIDAPGIDILNSAGNAVIRTPGPVSLVNNFRNTASGGELRLITQNGAIDTAAVAVQGNNGRIALIANDTAGGSTGGITVGSGGISSGGGDIVLHAADNITIDGTVAAGAGNVRMIAGTGPGINAGHAVFSGSNPAAATELVQDEFGMIVFNAPVSSGSMTLVSSTTATPTIAPVITQGAAGALVTTGALTAVSLRGGGAPGNGGGTIDLNDAAGNNSTGLINLFACSFDGCPVALPTAPFLNQGAPVPPFTTALYSDGQLFYSDVGGTNVTGIGTSGDFTLYTPGSVTITGPSLSAKNLTIEALVDINVDLLAPFTNDDINGGQPGGSLNFIAGQNLNYTSSAAGATIGSAASLFNHDLLFQAAGNVTIANAIHVGSGNLVVSANASANLNNNTVNIPASGTGSVLMQGNHVVSSQAGLTVSGINLTVQGGDTGSLNQSAAGQQLLSAGTIRLNLLGDVAVSGGTATGVSDSAAIVRGGVVDLGSAATPVANLAMTGGSSTVTGTANHVADALIEGIGSLNVHVAGDVTLVGGTAEITATAGSSQKAGASAILKGNNFLFNVAGNVSLAGGTANSATGGNTATANAQVIAGSAFNPLIQGNLGLEGGDATAQPIAGELANAVASARFESAGDLLLKVSGDIVLQGGQAVASNTAGGAFAEADAGAFVRSSAKIGIEAGQDFGITGGQASVSGTSVRAIASAGVLTGNIAAGQTLLVNTTGDMRMTGGFSNGAAGDAAALVYSSGEAKLNIGGPSGLRLEGGSGPFFPPFDAGVFTPNSDLFHMIGNDALVRISGSAYPVTVTGLITLVPNPARGAAFLVSEAPPLSLDSLLAAFIRTTDCVSFSGGACTLSEAAASGTRRGVKDPAGGVCK